MKKITILFLLISAMTKIQAQNYQISFAGTGLATTVDSVKIENLTQCTNKIVGGSDILNLSPTAGISELNTAEDINIRTFPNPTAGNCLIDFETIEPGKTTIVLYDISGKRILQVHSLLAKGHHTYSLNGIGSGIYTLKIESDKFFCTAKLISSNLSKGLAEIKHIESTGIEKRSSSSPTESVKSFKSDKSVIDMQFNTGDTLKLTAKSGIYKTVIMLAPTQNQIALFNFVACADKDHNKYSVVQIGTQVWMAENLKTTVYNDSTLIPNVIDSATWTNLTTGAYCWYDNNANYYASIYGTLYNWYAVRTGKLCPAGWHVPGEAEWTTLLTYLGDQYRVGGKLKETCSELWAYPNVGATNQAGFTGLPAGRRSNYSTYWAIEEACSWWSSQSSDALYAVFLDKSHGNGDSGLYNYNKQGAVSVRCIQD